VSDGLPIRPTLRQAGRAAGREPGQSSTRIVSRRILRLQLSGIFQRRSADERRGRFARIVAHLENPAVRRVEAGEAAELAHVLRAGVGTPLSRCQATARMNMVVVKPPPARLLRPSRRGSCQRPTGRRTTPPRLSVLRRGGLPVLPDLGRALCDVVARPSMVRR